MRPSLLALAALAAAGAGAQPADTLRTYELGEVVVGERRDAEPGASVGTIQGIPPATWRAADGLAVGELARVVPAAHVRSNSRGEMLFSLRGSDERHAAVFLDGVPLAIAWDQRVDLGLLPAGLMAGASVVKGAPSVLYGPNVPGGALNLATSDRLTDGIGVDLTVLGGWPRHGGVAGSVTGREGRWSWIAAGQGAGSEGFALASMEPVPFSQTSGDLRTNTDWRLASGYARVGFAPGAGSRIGLSVLLADGAKGVAPEGHLDPAVEQVRFWRYPTWRYGLASLHGERRAGAFEMRGAAWITRFAQSIEQFTGVAYNTLDAVQHDADAALGARLIVERAVGAGSLRLALHGTQAWHRVRETPGTGDPEPPRDFRHALASVGLEAEQRAARDVTLVAGASADVFAPHETGEQPAPGALMSLGLSGGAAWRTAPDLAVRASIGRRTRFPTMREWFDGALGRFIANPDLRPETVWSAEAGLERAGAGASIEAVAFGRLVDGTIDQETLPDGRRQRVNLGGSRVVGIELRGAARLPAAIRVDGHLTLMHARGRTDDEPSRLLAETPGLIAYLAVSRAPATGLTAGAEMHVTGAAYSRAPEGLVRLPPSAAVNLRTAWRWSPGREAFVRLQNAFDAVVLPQAGLPAPGREIRLGLALSW